MFVDIQPATCRLSNFLLNSSSCRSMPFLTRIRAIVPNIAIPPLLLFDRTATIRGKPLQGSAVDGPRESGVGAGRCARPLTSRHLTRPGVGRRPVQLASGRPGRPHDVSERQPPPALRSGASANVIDEAAHARLVGN